MSVLLDTNIAIHIRDGDTYITRKYAALPAAPSLSIVTVVALAGGLATLDPTSRDKRERLGTELIHDLNVVPFDEVDAEQYRKIVRQIGFARNRILDRMIAATALRYSMPIVTANVRDFRDIPGLQIEDWSQ